MAIYRVCRRLHAGKRGYIEPPAFTRLEWLTDDQRERLEDVGAVSRIRTPPLAELGERWKARAGRLQDAGILNIEQLLEADAKALAKEVGRKPATIQRWKADAAEFITVVPARHKGG